ncbi:MAG: STAS domain-containing protein [Anaerolineae bacterium]
MSAQTPVIVHPQGRMDAARAPALEQELRQQLAHGHHRLIVDLSKTTYISSNGLRVLLAAHKTAQQDGGSLKLCCLSPRLLEIFEMAGFDQIFEIYEDRNAAENAFAKVGG